MFQPILSFKYKRIFPQTLSILLIRLSTNNSEINQSIVCLHIDLDEKPKLPGIISSESEESSQDESLSSSVTSLDDDSVSGDENILSAVPVFRPPLLMRQRSQSMKTPEVEESEKDSETKVEDILKNNIKLWKAQQSVEEESDSVFESESSEEERL